MSSFKINLIDKLNLPFNQAFRAQMEISKPFKRADSLLKLGQLGDMVESDTMFQMFILIQSFKVDLTGDTTMSDCWNLHRTFQ